MKVDLSEAKQYEPKAVYYSDSDSLEYIREDIPTIYRRIDDILTLILSMESRDLIGFKLKGFKNFYQRSILVRYGKDVPEFIELVDLLKQAVEDFGNNIFQEENRRSAYDSALEIAAQDKVDVRDFPKLRA